ncbi:MAG: DUF5362 family protein [Calditrichaceae bacterium]
MEISAQDQTKLLNDLKISALNMSGWLKFVGIVTIIGGIIPALSIIGILIAWLPIWLGVLLWQAGSRASDAQLRNNPLELMIMLDKLRLYFVVQGILIIIIFGGLLIGLMALGFSLPSLFDLINQN